MTKLRHVYLFLVVTIGFSCAKLPLSHSNEEEFPLEGPKRAIIGTVVYPLQTENLGIKEEEIKKQFQDWAEDAKLSRDELDIVRSLKGGELKYVQQKIDSESVTKMSLLRNAGVIFTVHPQQILGGALTADPLLEYSQGTLINYVKWIYRQTLIIAGEKAGYLKEKLEANEAYLFEGISEELSQVQDFPYRYTSVQLTHSLNADQNWSAGFSNFNPVNALDGLHKEAPSLLLKALGLIYGMKEIQAQENFFTEEIRLEESYQDGLLMLLKKGKQQEAYKYLGRLLVLVSLTTIPAQMDAKYVSSSDIYRDQWLPLLLSEITEILSNHSRFELETGYFSLSETHEDIKKETYNLIENNLSNYYNVSKVMVRLAQTADFYSSTGKGGNERGFTLFSYPPDSNEMFQEWNYLPYYLHFIGSGDNEGVDGVVLRTKEGDIFTVSESIIEMSLHLRPLTIAGAFKIFDLLLRD